MLSPEFTTIVTDAPVYSYPGREGQEEKRGQPIEALASYACLPWGEELPWIARLGDGRYLQIIKTSGEDAGVRVRPLGPTAWEQAEKKRRHRTAKEEHEERAWTMVP
jgi:hypothetical protein